MVEHYSLLKSIDYTFC